MSGKRKTLMPMAPSQIEALDDPFMTARDLELAGEVSGGPDAIDFKRSQMPDIGFSQEFDAYLVVFPETYRKGNC